MTGNTIAQSLDEPQFERGTMKKDEADRVHYRYIIHKPALNERADT